MLVINIINKIPLCIANIWTILRLLSEHTMLRKHKTTQKMSLLLNLRAKFISLDNLKEIF